MGGKTSSALATIASSRTTVKKFRSPEFLDSLLADQRRTDVENWLQELAADYHYLNNDQLQAHFNFYFNQLEILGAEEDSISESAINDFTQTIAWLINNNIEESCEQSAANIAAICGHLQPNSNYQKIFEQLNGFDQNFDTDQYYQYIDEHIDPQQLDQAVDRHVQELADEGSKPRPRYLVREEIREAIIFDPELNGHLSLDLDDYDDWAAEQRRQQVARVLAREGVPSWVYDSQDNVDNSEELITFLTNFQQGPSSDIGRKIFNFDAHPQADKFFFDPETKTFFANRRSYELQLGGRRQIIDIQEKRSADGRGIMVKSDNQMTVRAARSAQFDYDQQPVIKAFLQLRGEDPVKLKVKEKHLQKFGGLQAWAIKALEDAQRQEALKNKLSADDPQAQAQRLVDF